MIGEPLLDSFYMEAVGLELWVATALARQPAALKQAAQKVQRTQAPAWLLRAL